MDEAWKVEDGYLAKRKETEHLAIRPFVDKIDIEVPPGKGQMRVPRMVAARDRVRDRKLGKHKDHVRPITD